MIITDLLVLNFYQNVQDALNLYGSKELVRMLIYTATADNIPSYITLLNVMEWLQDKPIFQEKEKENEQV